MDGILGGSARMRYEQDAVVGCPSGGHGPLRRATMSRRDDRPMTTRLTASPDPGSRGALVRSSTWDTRSDILWRGADIAQR